MNKKNQRQTYKIYTAHKRCAFCGGPVGQRFRNGNWAIVTYYDGSWFLAHRTCMRRWEDGEDVDFIRS